MISDFATHLCFFFCLIAFIAMMGDKNKNSKVVNKGKRHKCNLCHKSFIWNANLIVHMRSHTGDKPYNCQLCHKSFTCVGNLTVHKRSHTGEKPYKCQLCQKSFAHNSHLKRHIKTH